MILDLTGKNIVITGGCGWLGRAMVRCILESNASVLVTGTSEEKFKNTFVNELSNSKYRLFFLNLDLSKKKSVLAGVSSVFKRVDCLINNAYYCTAGHPIETSDVDMQISLEGTVGIYYRCIKELMPLLSDNSSVVNISSMYGMRPPDFNIYKDKKSVNPIGYGIGKAGVIHMTRYLAKFLAGKGIRINCVSPGAFPNPEVQKQSEFIDSLNRVIPMNRVGNPEELSGIVVFLCSNKSSYITGQNFAVDGGFTI